MCQIRYVACADIYLSGIRGCLDTLARHHHGWNYQLSPLGLYDEADLLIVDGTQYETIKEIPESLLFLLHKRSTLILVNAFQQALTDILEKECCCSILCVDEMTFHLRDILDVTMRGKRYLSPLIIRFKQKTSEETPTRLTLAEHRIMTFLKQGYSGVEIARLLFRSEKTVSSHKRRIMKKLGAKSDVELSQKINTLSTFVNSSGGHPGRFGRMES